MRIHIDAINKSSDKVLRKMYLSLYCKGCVIEGPGDRTKTAKYWHPQPLRASLCVVLLLLDGSTVGPEARGPSLSGTCSHPSMFSPTGLVSKLHRGARGPLLLAGGFPYHILSPTLWLPVLTELYNSSVVHSIFGMACLIVIKRK